MSVLMTADGEPFWCGTYLPQAQFLALLDAARDALNDRGVGWAVSASVGTCVLSVEVSSASAALALADRRMYAEKRRRAVGR